MVGGFAVVARQVPPRGQHWLVDQSSLAAIAGAIDLPATSLVVEIGPGRGHLTDHLLAISSELLAIEIDPDLVSYLQTRYANELASNLLRLELADCRRYDWESLPGGWRLCANIPYYLTAFLLRQLTDIKNQPTVAVLLLPRPVASKLEGGRGSLLAVIVGAQYEIELLQTVAPEAFEPPPQVFSQIIRLSPRGDRRESAIVDSWPQLCRFWRQAFGRPRQTLVNNLKSTNLPRENLLAVLAELGLSAVCRPGDLDRDQWLRLWARLQ